jgi:hypothetical protein
MIFKPGKTGEVSADKWVPIFPVSCLLAIGIMKFFFVFIKMQVLIRSLQFLVCLVFAV